MIDKKKKTNMFAYPGIPVSISDDLLTDEARAFLDGETNENSFSQKGGPGSGHFGHAGRPGKVGGSAPKDGIRSNSDSNDPMNNPNFRVWFEGSKVVDENGDPLIVYHGTTQTFESFSREKIGSKTDTGFFGSGYYFTPESELASSYAIQYEPDNWDTGFSYNGGRVLPVYLSVKNPYDFRNDPIPDGVPKEYSVTGKDQPNVRAYGSEAFRNKLEDMGFDGVFVYDDIIQSDKPASDDLWLAVAEYYWKNKPGMKPQRKWLDSVLLKGALYEDVLGYYGKDIAERLPKKKILREVVAFYPEQIKSIFNIGDFSPDDPRILKQTVKKGGPGSGHFGHAGRPGEVGGSLPKNGVISIREYVSEEEQKKRRAGESSVSSYAVPDEIAINRIKRGVNRYIAPGIKLDKLGAEGMNNSLSSVRSFFLNNTIAKKIWYGHGDDRWIDSVTGDKDEEVVIFEDRQGVQLLLNCFEDDFEVSIALIDKKPSRGVLGYSVMKALKKYCDITGKVLDIPMIANPGFFSKFPWIKPKKDSGWIHAYYDPRDPVQASKESGDANDDFLFFKGGPGSGHFGHAGRPGKVGGSTPKDSFTAGGERYSPLREKLLNDLAPQVDRLDALTSQRNAMWNEYNQSVLEASQRGGGYENARGIASRMEDYAKTEKDQKDEIRKAIHAEIAKQVDVTQKPQYRIHPVANLTDDDISNIHGAMDALSVMVDPSLFSGPILFDDAAGGRSYYDDKKNSLCISEFKIQGDFYESVFHEMGHYFESHNPDVLRREIDFYERRTNGERLLPLPGYGGLELAKKDRFYDGYVGKVYKNKSGEITATEILSMGLSALYTDPYRFMLADPEHFDLTVSIITGLSDVATKGGPGSGHFGHAGRPGKVGGSAPKDSAYAGGVEKKPQTTSQFREMVEKKISEHSKWIKGDTKVLHDMAKSLKEIPADAWDEKRYLLEEMSSVRTRIGRDSAVVNDVITSELRNFVDGKTPPYRIDRGGFQDESDEEEINEAMEIFGSMVRSDLFHEPVTFTSSEDDRSAYRVEENEIHLNGYWKGSESYRTIFHEMGHYIEVKNKDILARLVEFYKRRTAGELESEIRGLKGEYTRKDNFFDDYVGKVYEDRYGKIHYTEILSMGLESLISNPYGFMQADPDHFDLIVSIITGLPYDVTTKGGPGSGHFGHAGRPGKVGGSAPKDSIAGGQFHSISSDYFTVGEIDFGETKYPAADVAEFLRYELDCSDILVWNKKSFIDNAKFSLTGQHFRPPKEIQDELDELKRERGFTEAAEASDELKYEIGNILLDIHKRTGARAALRGIIIAESNNDFDEFLRIHIAEVEMVENTFAMVYMMDGGVRTNLVLRMPKNGKIDIESRSGFDLTSILAHEYAHAVWFEKSHTEPYFISKWMNTWDRKPDFDRFTGYSHFDPAEAFAETFALYCYSSPGSPLRDLPEFVILREILE